MRNTPLKAFTKSALKHSLDLTKEQHSKEHDTSVGKKLKQSLKKIKDK